MNAVQQETSANFAPEIEARRAEYECLAEALVTMTHLHTEYVESRLEIESHLLVNDHSLMDTIDMHLRVLCTEKLDWFAARTIRKFYVEMRLWADHLATEFEQRHESAG